MRLITEMEIRCYTGSKDMKISSFNILEPIGELFTDYKNIDFIAINLILHTLQYYTRKVML